MGSHRTLTGLVLAILLLAATWIAWPPETCVLTENASSAGQEPAIGGKQGEPPPRVALETAGPATSELPERHPQAQRPEYVDGMVRVGDLSVGDAQNIQKVNRVLQRAGRALIEPDAMMTADEVTILFDMVSACEKEINASAQAVLDFQQPLANEMAKSIMAHGGAGRPIPYQVIPNGVLPPRHKYDLFVTSAYKGVVYLAIMPKTQESMDLVDATYLAEHLRLDAYTSFASEVRARSNK